MPNAHTRQGRETDFPAAKHRPFQLTRSAAELDYLPDTTAETVNHLLQSASAASMRAAACHRAGRARLEQVWNNMALAYTRQATALDNTLQITQP